MSSHMELPVRTGSKALTADLALYRAPSFLPPAAPARLWGVGSVGNGPAVGDCRCCVSSDSSPSNGEQLRLFTYTCLLTVDAAPECPVSRSFQWYHLVIIVARYTLARGDDRLHYTTAPARSW